MEDNRIHYFEKTETIPQKEFIKAQNHCILCGTTLELQHIRDNEKHEIQEEARCIECDIKARVKIYTLQ